MADHESSKQGSVDDELESVRKERIKCGSMGFHCANAPSRIASRRVVMPSSAREPCQTPKSVPREVGIVCQIDGYNQGTAITPLRKQLFKNG